MMWMFGRTVVMILGWGVSLLAALWNSTIAGYLQLKRIEPDRHNKSRRQQKFKKGDEK